MHKPSFGAIIMGLIPFLGMCFSVSLWDCIYPVVFGLPFNMFWLCAWVILTPLFMWRAYVIELSHIKEGSSDE